MNEKSAMFAGGCFWGMEYYFNSFPGVIRVSPGYAGGHKESPTYEEVCSGTTGHLEVVQVIYDPEKTTYEDLARLFFEIHDPTQVDGQGPDLGEQYLSAVFTSNEDERRILEKLIGELESLGYRVATEIFPEAVFWVAEDYHHAHYEIRGTTPYCHHRVKRFG